MKKIHYEQVESSSLRALSSTNKSNITPLPMLNPTLITLNHSSLSNILQKQARKKNSKEQIYPVQQKLLQNNQKLPFREKFDQNDTVQTLQLPNTKKQFLNLIQEIKTHPDHHSEQNPRKWERSTKTS